jgi:hypothetical protein
MGDSPVGLQEFLPALQCFDRTEEGNTLSLWIRANSLIKASVSTLGKVIL